MRQLITYFIKYPITGNVLLLLIFIFGIFGLSSLRKTFFPEFESRNIYIETVYPGSSPEEIEKSIILKIEDEIESISGIERVTSNSVENSGSINIEVQKGYNPNLVLTDIKNTVDRINSFPDAMEPPTIYIRENLGFAISFAISGDIKLQGLKTFAQKIESDLKNINGLSKVTIGGYPAEEIQISFREKDLRTYNLNLDQLSNIIQKENIDVTGGRIKGEKEDLLIRGNNKKYTAEEISDIIVKVVDDKIIRLKDVADVNQGWIDQPNRKFFNSKKAVVITVSNTIFEDLGLITEEVRDYIDEFNKKNNTVKATIIRDNSDTVNQRIELLTSNGIIGFLLVLFFLSLFLRPSIAFWVALSIPISFAGMFIVAAYVGLTLNVISLFGMIVVIGILVDDGIVIAENIFQHYEKGKEPIQAAIDGTMEVLPAVFSAIVTTAIAFSIFFFIDGRMGDFFPDMGFVVIATLSFSLVEGALILPAHIAFSRALKTKNKVTLADRVINVFTRIMNYTRDKFYKPLLDFTLDAPWIIILACVGLFYVTITGMKTGAIKMTFFPFIENDNIAVNLKLQPGTNDAITTKWMDEIEAKVWKVNRHLSDSLQGGESVIRGIEKTVGPSSEEGSLNIILIPGETRKVKTILLTKQLKDIIGEIPNSELLSYSVSSPFGKAISVALYSEDERELSEAKNKLKFNLSELGILKNIESSDQPGLQEVNLKLKDQAYLLGLTTRDVVGAIRGGFFGIEAQRLQIGSDEIKVWLRYDELDRNSIGNLEQMQLTFGGKKYFARDLVTFELKRGVSAIEHIDGKRSILISSDMISPEIDNPEDVISKIEDDFIPAIKADYPSINHSVEGQKREVGKVQKSAKKVIPIILILMITVIILAFRSFLQAGAVVAMIPFGLIGVAWGHFLHGDQLSIFSWFGVIALIGIMVNDALVFVTAMNINLKQNMSFKEALRDAGLSRYRPIILTSLTTVAGLAPLIAETSFQAQFLIPMAISIAYGLVMATLLTLLFLPAVLVMINKLRIIIKWLLTGEVQTPEQVEPAVKEIENEKLKLH